MNIGKMRHRLQLQEQSVMSDNEGIAENLWTTVYTFWADVRPIGGEIAFRQYGITDEDITKRVYCRPYSKIKAGSRVVHGENIYEISYVADYPDHYEVLLRSVDRE